MGVDEVGVEGVVVEEVGVEEVMEVVAGDEAEEAEVRNVWISQGHTSQKLNWNIWDQSESHESKTQLKMIDFEQI